MTEKTTTQPDPASQSCRTCGEPLPPHVTRGRPRVAHLGECARLERNRRTSEARWGSFRRHEQDRAPDRSTGAIPWMAQASTDEVAALDGFSIVNVHASGRDGWHQRREFEEKRAAQRRAWRNGEALSDVGAWPNLTDDEIRTRIAELQAAASSPEELLRSFEKAFPFDD
jgi:hypothetical protein